MSRTSGPRSRSFAAVPPVETSSTPRLASLPRRVYEPVLSESEMSALWTGTRSVIRYFLCVVQLERRNCQATSPPIAATSPRITN